jgi:hypothetical protein
MKKNVELVEKLVAHINRKEWWHVPPRDGRSYSRRGKFYSSSFKEAEFWGRPLDEPQRVLILKPLVGDERTIEKSLFGKQVSSVQISMKGRWSLDARMKRTALGAGYDSIVLMTSSAFAKFRLAGKMPRSLELNILDAAKNESASNEKRDKVRSTKHKLSA